MKRPWLIGFAFAICLAVVFAAMAWISVRAVRLDRDEASARRLLALEEDVRLALSRMDSLVGPLILQENARPYFLYRAFYSPQRAYTEMYAPIEFSKIRVPSPLLTYRSEFVLLHFEIDPEGNLTSPQVPQSNMRDVAESQFISHEEIAAAEQRLVGLRKVITRDVAMACLPAVPRAGEDPLVLSGLALNQLANGSQQQQLDLNPNEVFPNSGVNDPVQQQSATPNQSASEPANQRPNPGPQQLEPNAPAQGQQGGQAGQSSLLPSGKPQAPTPEQQADANYRLSPRSVAEWQARNSAQFAYGEQQVKSKNDNNRDGPLANVTEGVMRPFWLDGSLIVARRVNVGGKDYVQGAWLNWPRVQAWLNDSVSDLFPDAEIVPRINEADDGPRPRMLATIPATLVTSASPVVIDEGWTAVKSMLVAAWACILLAAAAVGVLLFGAVALSERRGAFVGAVTHELRTPLTTFRMYTEMLEAGMVRDPATRDLYLATMRREADRLGHLVENVLAYSRLERSSPASRAVVLPVSQLVERVTERLSQRAEQAGMKVEVNLNGGGEAKVKADPAAVEQILFNLVDNACKYAATAEDRTIHIEAALHNGHVKLHVRDHGPGISAQEAGRLFQPFRKSAKDAAHSAPGVGLGLALSRRLAIAMGGKLAVNGCGEGGACLELTLPVAKG
ncbi:MAG: HAMP domain-containing sensor histidine kinase [Phycisphaeraceae bacterium]